MLVDILIFLVGFFLGAATLWVYGFVTDKVALAKTGYGLGKTIVMFFINKFKKKTLNDTSRRNVQ